MAQYTKLPGKGTILQSKITGAFVTIGQRFEITGPKPTLNMIKSTDLDSTKEEYIPGIPDGDKVGFTVWYNPNDAIHIAILARIYTPPLPNAPDEFKLIYNDGSATTPASEDFFGFITKFDRTGFKQGELVQAAGEIQLTGTHTITAGV